MTVFGLSSDQCLRLCIRLFCLSVLIYHVITVPVSWHSLMLLLLFLGSIYFLRSATPEVTGNKNSQKEKKTKDIVNELYPLIDKHELDRNVNRQVCDFVTYDATDVESVQNFKEIQQNTECIFSKNAFIWGSKGWNNNISLEENVFRCLPTFLKFTVLCRQRRIDGFVFELPGDEYGQNIESFGNGVRRVLKVLSDNDPAGVRCMDKSYVGKKGWVFEFNKWTFFITTFAPFYPETHSRFAFGCKNCYILMQPEISFALHDLPPDTPETNWDKPVTIRDKIRIAFRNAGRPYCMKHAYFNPMSWDVVKSIQRNDPVLEWWKA